MERIRLKATPAPGVDGCTRAAAALRCVLGVALFCHLLSACQLGSHPPGPWSLARTAASPGQARSLAMARALPVFQRHLIRALDARMDVGSRLGAALLARSLALPVEARGSFHALMQRAAQVDGAGAAVSWLQLADCDARVDACPNARALAKLVQQAPDNAAVWLLKLGQDRRHMRTQAVYTDLVRAATAKGYDDYAGHSLKALAQIVAMLPLPPESLDPVRHIGPASVRMMLAFSLGALQPQPVLPVVAVVCQDKAGHADVKADCLRLGRLLARGSSPLARSLGLHLLEILGGGRQVRQQARIMRRDLAWQVRQFARLVIHAASHQKEAARLLTLARQGHTQMRLMLDALRQASIATHAPVVGFRA